MGKNHPVQNVTTQQLMELVCSSDTSLQSNSVQ